MAGKGRVQSARSLRDPKFWVYPFLGALVVVLLGFWAFRRSEPFDRPVTCLRVALGARSISVEEPLLEAADKILAERSIRISRRISTEITNRVVSDTTLIQLMRECASGAPVRVEDAWVGGVVQQRTPGGTKRPASGATVRVQGGATCTTDSQGHCELRIRADDLFAEVSATAQLDGVQVDRFHAPDGVWRERMPLYDLIRQDIVFELDPPAKYVKAVVTRCGTENRVTGASLQLSIPQSDAWSAECGIALPTRADCRIAKISNGEAGFFVTGEPTEMRFVLIPDQGPPESFPPRAWADVVALVAGCKPNRPALSEPSPRHDPPLQLNPNPSVGPPASVDGAEAPSLKTCPELGKTETPNRFLCHCSNGTTCEVRGRWPYTAPPTVQKLLGLIGDCTTWTNYCR